MERLIRIKITANENDDFISSFLKLPGYMPINVQVYLKKCFSYSEVKKEGSLKFFLQKYDLDSKDDISYDKM